MDFLSFVWNIISSFINTIINIINFVKNLALEIPNLFNFFPTEISIMLVSALGIIVAIFIFKFVK